MSYIANKDFHLEVAKGNIARHSLVHKFGAGNLDVTMKPVTGLGIYQTPTLAKSLEIISDNAADNVAGIGAREITITGLDADWNEITQTIVPNGLNPVVIPTNLIRMYRWFVSKSGTYADSANGSHQGNLTIREAGGGANWDQIKNTPIATGQSQIGVYTVPIGKTAYLRGKLIFTDTAKTADIYMYERRNANDVAAPFTGAMRISEREVGVQGGFDHHFKAPKGGIVGPCDIGFMGKVSSGTAECSVEFEILLVDNI